MKVIEKSITRTGVKNTTRILHITDLHIVLWDNRDDSLILERGNFKDTVSKWAVTKIEKYKCEDLYAHERFSEICRDIRSHADEFDAVVFSGDILDFYTDKARELLEKELQDLPIPYVFAMGNHDLISSPDREAQVRESFRYLCGGDTYFKKISIGEVSVIGLDNASKTYKKEMLEKLKNALEGEKNVIIAEHLPIYENEHPSDKYDGRAEFFRILNEKDSPVFAILGGDDHVDREIEILPGLTQYVSSDTLHYPPVLFKIQGE